MAKVEIKQDGLQYHVILDGKDVSNVVTSFSFCMDAKKDKIPILKLDVIATDMDIDGSCKPVAKHPVKK